MYRKTIVVSSSLSSGHFLMYNISLKLVGSRYSTKFKAKERRSSRLIKEINRRQNM
jgi:hypothetical protein